MSSLRLQEADRGGCLQELLGLLQTCCVLLFAYAALRNTMASLAEHTENFTAVQPRCLEEA